MSYLKISLGIFLALAASRFMPHPPNFTSLLALSFYVPALLGKKYIPALVISFIITDSILGIHQTIIFTWGSIILICLMSSVFKGKIYQRIVGALGGVLIFFIITNFGVWSSGMYPFNLNWENKIPTSIIYYDEMRVGKSKDEVDITMQSKPVD